MNPTARASALRDARIITDAIRFTATIYSGQGRYTTGEYGSLAEAAASAKHMTRTSTNGRTALIYAVDASGAKAMVPMDYADEVLFEALAAG